MPRIAYDIVPPTLFLVWFRSFRLLLRLRRRESPFRADSVLCPPPTGSDYLINRGAFFSLSLSLFLSPLIE